MPDIRATALFPSNELMPARLTALVSPVPVHPALQLPVDLRRCLLLRSAIALLPVENQVNQKNLGLA